jgi:dsDNA-specific endonuclease/ATPase MutS2
MKNLLIISLLLVISSSSYGQWNYRIDYEKRKQRDQELRDYERELKAENEEKIAKLSEMLAIEYTGIPYIDQKLEKMAEDKRTEVEDIIDEYGDPFESQEALSKLKRIESTLKNNQWYQEAARIEKNLEKLENDYQNNSITKEQFDAEYKKYSDYIELAPNSDYIKVKWYYVRPIN